MRGYQKELWDAHVGQLEGLEGYPRGAAGKSCGMPMPGSWKEVVAAHVGQPKGVVECPRGAA